jgi:hypothetical protein
MTTGEGTTVQMILEEKLAVEGTTLTISRVIDTYHLRYKKNCGGQDFNFQIEGKAQELLAKYDGVRQMVENHFKRVMEMVNGNSEG